MSLQSILHRLGKLESGEVGILTSALNVSNPPTDAELDAEFGAASALYDGFQVIIDDNGSGLLVWNVVVMNSGWWYEQMTQAV